MPALSEQDRGAIRDYVRRRQAEGIRREARVPSPRAPAAGNGFDRAVLEHRINDLSLRIFAEAHVEGAGPPPGSPGGGLALVSRVERLERDVFAVWRAPAPRGPRGPF